MLKDITIPCIKFKEGKKVIIESPVLDIATFGKNEEEAKKRFVELVLLFFEELEDMGTLDEVLKELGWRKETDSFGKNLDFQKLEIKMPCPV